MTREPMLDMFIFETTEMVDQLQQIMMKSEKALEISSGNINEIFRIMHTIKGSSGMMMFDNISHLAHAVEDIFFFIREDKPENIDFTTLADLVLESGDCIREETERINDEMEANTDFSALIDKVENFLIQLKQVNGQGEVEEPKPTPKPAVTQFYVMNDKGAVEYKYLGVILFFEEKCEMENIRSFTVLHKLKELADVLHHEPEDILSDKGAVEDIRQNGFRMYLRSELERKEIENFVQETIFLDHYDIVEYPDEKTMMSDFMAEELPLAEVLIDEKVKEPVQKKAEAAPAPGKPSHKSSMISVDVHKLDMLMDLVGELVISESMVTNNPELKNLQLDDFFKAVRQHRKRITDLQDVVMSIRMVSLAPTLAKMTRIVRDMCKKLDKKAELVIIGENTEVDKNIIEHIGDPLMHIVRNSMDHGIEPEVIRTAKLKEPVGKIIIEAKNAGGDVLITIRDDGKGLDRSKILERGIENGIIQGDGKNLTDREVFATIFSPGLSTKDVVTEFSGRGVGMDVVVKEIEKVRGSVTVDSVYGAGTTVTIKIPLTIAILDGMLIRVGESIFTIPVTSIKQSIIVKKEEVFRDLDNKEMITIRGECFSILRLHELYQLPTDVTQIEDGIVIMVEEDGKAICLFADELIGEQQVVIKALPEYINRVKGTSGCNQLGNGAISLILDIAQLINL